MSYILDALKKAQAERQLGSAPTLHAAPPMYAGVDADPARPWRIVALTALVCVAAGAALFWWLRAAPPANEAAQAAQASAAPGLPAPVVAAAPAPAGPAPAAPAPAAPVPAAPGPAAPMPVAPMPAAPMPAAPAAAAPVRAPVPAAASAAPAPVVTAPSVALAAQEGDDALPLMQELPQHVRQTLPRVAFGGYIYSPQPADRLLLVDNVLRREGEEVAPGLVLERLLPQAAVMNYRGLRYRVVY